MMNVQVVAGQGGLPAIRVQSEQGSGLVYLHGAHVASWKPRGAGGGGEMLWVSGKSQWAVGKPIRGGIPICFPWFGAKAGEPAAPAHGFARLREWKGGDAEEVAGGVRVTLTLESDAQTKALWDADFKLTLAVTFGESLEVRLELENRGTKEFSAEEALHTYFAVPEVRAVTVRGLEGVTYIDKVDGMKRKVQEGEIRIVGETDRVYVGTRGDVTLTDGRGGEIVVSKTGSEDTVVWNPWVAKAKAMADFGDEEWPGMICVETCNVGEHAVRVRPGEMAVMGAVYRLKSERA